jgi:hypothetical protein
VYLSFHTIQFCTIHFISILIPFSYILSSLHSHIHILIQSTITEKNKKFLQLGLLVILVFLLVLVCWWGSFNWDFQILNWFSKIVNYFFGFEPTKKNERNTRTRMNPSQSALPEAQRVDHSLCGLRISIFKFVHCGASCGKHANPARARPYLYSFFVIGFC